MEDVHDILIDNLKDCLKAIEKFPALDLTAS